MASFEDYFDLDMAMSMDWNTREEDKASSSPAATEEEITSFVSDMPTVLVAAHDGATAAAECAVCLESFGHEHHSSAKRLPCCHVYHSTCIAQWLSLHDSCPLCRSKIFGPTRN